MSFLPYTKKSSVSLVIQENEIRLLQLVNNKKGCYVKNMAVQHVPREENLLDSLKELVISTGTKGAAAALALSSHQVIQKTITLSKEFKQQELYMEFKTNLLNYLPDVDDELFFDFAVIAEDKQEQLILLTACRKTIINSYISLCQSVGLNLKVLDIDYYALARAAIFSLDKKNVSRILLQFHQENLYLLIIKQNHIFFYQQLPFDNASQITQLLYSKLTKYDIENVILIDNCPRQLKLFDLLHKELPVPVHCVDPFGKIQLPPDKNIADIKNKMFINLGLLTRNV